MICGRCKGQVASGRTHYCSAGAPFTVLDEKRPYPERGDIIRALASRIAWVKDGLAEGAYADSVGGNEIAIRCIENAEAVIKHLEGGSNATHS